MDEKENEKANKDRLSSNGKTMGPGVPSVPRGNLKANTHMAMDNKMKNRPLSLSGFFNENLLLQLDSHQRRVDMLLLFFFL